MSGLDRTSTTQLANINLAEYLQLLLDRLEGLLACRSDGRAKDEL
jgi:hypothetical protein